MPTRASSTFIGPIKSSKELVALLDILAPTFNFSRQQGEQYSAIVGKKNYRVFREGSAILGGCALLPLGQFFGGKSVPMMGVAAVGIAPEHRGRRIATALMQSALREMHRTGWPLSALYPATLPLYRSVGYEQAGVRYEVRIPAKTMIFRRQESDLELRRITTKDEPAIKEVYRTKAAHCAGNLDRSDFIWHRVRTPRGQATQGFMVVNRTTGKPEGYTYYLQKECPEAPYSLHVTDLVAVTPAAGRRLLSFFADHRSMTHEIIFQGTPDDPILKLLPERNYTARLLDHWMVRIVDVPAALLARGFPVGLSAEVHLDVEDDLLVANNGRFVLELRNGAPHVHSGGRGDLKVDIRGLASLYSGHLNPHQLLFTGQLQTQGRAKAASQALEAATATFGGPSPWLPDMF
jgi:predicted acetyltransferase